jgi:hypothetical protein
MKIKLLLFSCLLSTCLLSQKLYFIGEFSENQFKQTQKNIDKLTNFKIYQKTKANSKPVKVKSFQLNNVIISNSNNPNHEKINAIVKEFKNKSTESQIVYIANTIFSQSTKIVLPDPNGVITFEEFIKNSHKYQKTVNLFLLLNSHMNIDITNPISQSNITNLSFRIKGIGSSNYPITKIKYKTSQNNWEEIAVDDNIISYGDGEEFSFDLSPSIPEFNKKSFSLKLIFFNALDDTIQREIKDLTVVEPYLTFEEYYSSDKDLGTLIPKRIDNLREYKNNFVGIVFEIHLNTNINFYSKDFKLKVEYFDKNLEKLDIFNFELDVIKCGLNSIIPVLRGFKTPLPYIVNGDDVYNGQDAIYTTIPVGEQHLCDKAWDGYVRFSIPNSTVKTELMFARLRGYNNGDDTKFTLIECR